MLGELSLLRHVLLVDVGGRVLRNVAVAADAWGELRDLLEVRGCYGFLVAVLLTLVNLR